MNKILFFIIILIFTEFNAFSNQKLKLTIFDCCNQPVDASIKNNINEIIYEYFNNKKYYRVTSFQETEKILKNYKIKNNKVSSNKLIKIGMELNSDIIIEYDILKNNNKIILQIKCIKIESSKILFNKKIIYTDKSIDKESLLSLFDTIDKLLQNEEYMFKHKKNQLIKRTVLVIPFYNSNNVVEYDYLSGLMRDALHTELVSAEKLLFVDFSKIDTYIKNNSIKIKDLMDETNAKEFAWQLGADVVVIGKYVIIENDIMINISATDILINRIVASNNIKGELGIDVFRIIDESAKDIADMMNKNLDMISQNYFDQMQRLKNKLNTNYKNVYDNNPKYWRRHFFDISLGAGFFYNYPIPNNSLGLEDVGYGASLSGNFGYLYGFNKYFGFGPGFRWGYGFIYVNKINEINPDGHNLISTIAGSGVLLQFMWGDIKDKKIAFLLDIGGGYLFTIHLGIMYKNFICKAGYDLSHFGTGHNFTLSFGIMLNWSRKKKK